MLSDAGVHPLTQPRPPPSEEAVQPEIYLISTIPATTPTQVSTAKKMREFKPPSYFKNLVTAAPQRSKSLKQIELVSPNKL